MNEREVLKLALEALKQIDEAMPFPVAKLAIMEAEKALAQPEQEPEFVTHNVDKPYDWSEWVCPNPSGYLMKCCDCGLVHEAEFGVVRYKSETEREDCDMVNDPNLQAVFRMRRSEKWSPEDTAHRAGGLPMAQPEQEPVAWIDASSFAMMHQDPRFDRVQWQTTLTLSKVYEGQMPLYTTPPQRTWVGLTDEQKLSLEIQGCKADVMLAELVEQWLKEKNT